MTIKKGDIALEESAVMPTGKRKTKYARYEATPEGAVVEVVTHYGRSHRVMVYEPMPESPVTAEQIVEAMDYNQRHGIEPHWDWAEVEERLVEQGVLDECRA